MNPDPPTLRDILFAEEPAGPTREELALAITEVQKLDELFAPKIDRSGELLDGQMRRRVSAQDARRAKGSIHESIIRDRTGTWIQSNTAESTGPFGGMNRAARRARKSVVRNRPKRK
jgi:hypothetical protein